MIRKVAVSSSTSFAGPVAPDPAYNRKQSYIELADATVNYTLYERPYFECLRKELKPHDFVKPHPCRSKGSYK